MDGVLSDFDRGCEDLPNGLMDYPYAGYDWWADLEWMPHGKLVWKAAHSLFNDVHLLSSRGISDEEESIAKEIDAGKRGWAKSHLKPSIPDDKIHTVEESHRKVEFVAENAILVDDRDDTIADWVDSGGVGILHHDAHYRETIVELLRLSKHPIKLAEMVKRFRQ